ncbi:MAG: beta-galactosidase [Chthoniobacterales bacterium]
MKKNGTPKNSCLKHFVLLSFLLELGVGALSATTYRVEAEKAGAGSINKVLVGEPSPKNWTVEKVENASEGALLSGTISGETNPIPIVIPQAGTYQVWVRHYTTQGKYTSFYVLFRDNLGVAVDFNYVDFSPGVGTAKPKVVKDAPKDAKPELVWSTFEITFERPMEGTLSFGPSQGTVGGTVGVDCVIVTDDKAFDATKADIAKISTDAGAMQKQTPPAGMQPAPVITAHSSFFTGEADPEKQFVLAFINQAASYRDYGWAVQMGGNTDHGWTNGSSKFGIGTMALPDYGYMHANIAKLFPEPAGRFVNAEGKASKRFSLSYAPFRKEYMKQMAVQLQNFKDDKDTKVFRASDEGSGFYDYSDAAKNAFHNWLKQRFGTIEKLNTLWRSDYKSFDDIPLPRMPAEKDNKAAWFAFREFSGLEYATFIADKAKVIRENDPQHRHATSQSSCLSINAPTFTSKAPMDFEEVINIGFANEPEFGVDAYSTADGFTGCDIDFLLSLTKDKRLINNEFNVHSQDPRNMAQAYWGMVGKGVKGIATWTFQSSPKLWMYYMWALLNSDDTPRDKLGPIADANQEIHRLERILGSTKAIPFVKPVALYYSRMDLSLKQTTLGVFSSAIDNPYRIYAILRGQGYTVRWITPKQISEGALKDVSAVFMLGANHVPADAATKLAQWVKGGGCLVGDQWPGGFDEYDRTQETLMDVFGIRPKVIAAPLAAEKVAANDALTMSQTPVGGGVDPEVLRTLSGDDLLRSVEEMWDQWDSKHPVAKATRNWHLSGFELKKVEVVVPTAEVIGMSMGRKSFPGLVINDFGKGDALYSAIMLGTLFESGPVSFEWDSSREGPGLSRILNAFLEFSGVERLSQTGLPERLGWRMRIETPLTDPKGNVFVGMTSLNEIPLPAFPLTLRWPVAAPKMLMSITAGSREMKQLPFEVKDGKLMATVPGFDTAASLLALSNSDPLISLDISGAPRGVAGMLDVTPNTRLKVKATVWNPSAKKLPAGEVKLFTAPGWFCVAGEQKVEAIEPYGHQEVNFEIEAPAICTKFTIRPLVFKYTADKVTSTPCTEMVWWKNVKNEVADKVSSRK